MTKPRKYKRKQQDRLVGFALSAPFVAMAIYLLVASLQSSSPTTTTPRPLNRVIQNHCGWSMDSFDWQIGMFLGLDENGRESLLERGIFSPPHLLGRRLGLCAALQSTTVNPVASFDSQIQQLSALLMQSDRHTSHVLGALREIYDDAIEATPPGNEGFRGPITDEEHDEPQSAQVRNSQVGLLTEYCEDTDRELAAWAGDIDRSHPEAKSLGRGIYLRLDVWLCCAIRDVPRDAQVQEENAFQRLFIAASQNNSSPTERIEAIDELRAILRGAISAPIRD